MMSQHDVEVTHDLSVYMMVVLIVALVMGYLFSRTRWLTSEKGHRLLASPLSANKLNPRFKFVFGNLIINIHHAKTKM